MKQRVAVVIPYYHSDMSILEKISLTCCKTVLGNHPIILLVPDAMESEDIFYEAGITCRRVPNEWMKSVEDYNKMMLSPSFYEFFIEYEYILIYQLDAFVFKDALERFCEYGYDYIGAPWLHGMKYLKNRRQGVWYVGNGGFSLRRVSSFLQLLRSQKEMVEHVNEDLFFASCNSDKFRVAPIEVALQFSYERDVRECYELSGENIPFGCHAWEKYDFEFWKPFMKSCGKKICELLSKTESVEQILSPSKNFQYLEVDKACVDRSLLALFQEHKKDEIVVFGAGEWGKECCWLLQKTEKYKVFCVDNDPNMWGKILWDTCVLGPDILKERRCDDACIIVAVKNTKKEIMSQLQEYGYRHGIQVVFYDEVVEQIRRDLRG